MGKHEHPGQRTKKDRRVEKFQVLQKGQGTEMIDLKS